MSKLRYESGVFASRLLQVIDTSTAFCLPLSILLEELVSFASSLSMAVEAWTALSLPLSTEIEGRAVDVSTAFVWVELRGDSSYP